MYIYIVIYVKLCMLSWVGLGCGIKANGPHMGPGPAEEVPSVGNVC